MLTIKCKISVSKKLRAIMQKENGFISLNATGLNNGVGEARLSFPEIEGVDDVNIGETSIIIEPVEIIAEIDNPEFTTSNIFHTNVTNADIEEETPLISKIATVKPPEEKKVRERKVKTPKPFKKEQEMRGSKYINSIEELVSEIKVASSKNVDRPDIDGIRDARQKALELEKWSSLTSIDKDAFVVYEGKGVLTINDIGVSLHGYSPLNLSKISSHTLGKSRDLFGLLKEGYLKFIAPEDVADYMEKAQLIADNDVRGLEVYDNRKAAERAIEDGDEDEDDVDEEGEKPTRIIDASQRKPIPSPTPPTKSKSKKPSKRAEMMEITEENMNAPSDIEQLINLIPKD